MTKRKSSFGYESSHVLRGRVSVGDIFVKGIIFVYEGCSEDFLYIFFIDTLFLLCDSKPCILIYIYIYIYILRLLLQFHLSLHVLFLFSLYAHASYLLYAIFYFCFTLRCCDEFCLKCFRNTGCQSLSCHELSSCKVFEEIDFIVFNK